MSNLIRESVHVTDDLHIGLQYDRRRGLLDIFVKNVDPRSACPLQINVLTDDHRPAASAIQSGSCRADSIDGYHSNSIVLSPDDTHTSMHDLSYGDEDEPQICIELSTIYVYDVVDENTNELCQASITSPTTLLLASPALSSSSSSSCYDEQTSDNDDGYSTHSLDDTELQPSSPLSSSSKSIVPFVPSRLRLSGEPSVSSIRRLVERVMWRSPFRRTVTEMMLKRVFH